jgi:Zn-dependent protease
MPRLISLGRIAGLKVSARPSVLVAFLILWILLTSAFYWLMGFPVEIALAGGFAGALLHYATGLWHHISHALAARKSGFPMAGIVFRWYLATSRYPSHEGNLPARTHIQRALGGPAGSLALVIALIILALTLVPGGSLLWWLLIFAAADSLLVFTLGSLLPLGFTDGSTLLYWMSKRD